MPGATPNSNRQRWRSISSSR